MIADHDVAEWRIAFVDKAVAGSLTRRKAHIIAGLDAMPSVTEAERRFAFEGDDVFFLEEMIVERHGLLARRQLLIGDADLSAVLARIREYPIAESKPRALAPLRPGHTVDGDRASGLF